MKEPEPTLGRPCFWSDLVRLLEEGGCPGGHHLSCFDSVLGPVQSWNKLRHHFKGSFSPYLLFLPQTPPSLCHTPIRPLWIQEVFHTQKGLSCLNCTPSTPSHEGALLFSWAYNYSKFFNWFSGDSSHRGIFSFPPFKHNINVVSDLFHRVLANYFQHDNIRL